MIKILLLLSCVFVSAASASSNESGGLVDLSAGIVFPSENGAIGENPAALGFEKEKIFDVNGWPNSGSAVLDGSFAAGIGQTGFGFGARKVGSDALIRAGIGHSFGPLAIGVNLVSNSNNIGNPAVGLGLRSGEMGPVSFAFFTPDLTAGQREWIFGAGFNGAEYLKLEADLDLAFENKSFSVNTGTLDLGAEFYTSKQFSILFRYPLQIIPSVSTTGEDLTVGLLFWPTHALALYVYFSGQDLVGLKYSF